MPFVHVHFLGFVWYPSLLGWLSFRSWSLFMLAGGNRHGRATYPIMTWHARPTLPGLSILPLATGSISRELL